MFDAFQKFLPKAASQYGFTKQLQAVQICQEYRNLAPTLLPTGVLDETYPQSYQRQTLTIGVLNSTWANQVMMQKHRIIAAINKKFGPTTVKDLRITMVTAISQDSTPDA